MLFENLIERRHIVEFLRSMTNKQVCTLDGSIVMQELITIRRNLKKKISDYLDYHASLENAPRNEWKPFENKKIYNTKGTNKLSQLYDTDSFESLICYFTLRERVRNRAPSVREVREIRSYATCKMLYVFNVTTGTMINFDMGLAIESVAHLQDQIMISYNITRENQILLVSGGEPLDRNARVCSYSAGTDTNPIYLFSRTDIESQVVPPPTIESLPNHDFTTKVKELHGLPATYNTVCQRVQLAQHFHESAKEEHRVCQNLVHEQHLQQQGWAAVIANLEDNIVSFTKRSQIFVKAFEDFMNERESYLKFLEHFQTDLETLSKIPMLSVLQQSEKKFEKNLQQSKSATVSSKTESEAPEKSSATLLEWISSTDSKSTTDQLYEHCSKVLEQYDTKIFEALHEVLANIFKEAEKEEMKEIKGLGDRLCGLEQLMFEAKRYLQEQGDLAKSFLQNQNRATNIGDASILPDLCASHRKQLMVMLSNHQQLSDIRRRCVRAKLELGVNLHHRLKWVMYIENLMVNVDRQMIVYHETLRRVRMHLEILQQIHLAPATYLSAVAEVVRRRAFSQAFLSWASELACYLLTIHNEEITRRRDFQGQFENHFLSVLFPGMEDMPPAFAIEAPSIFDSTLPKLTMEDIELLKQILPSLAENVNVPDVAVINNLFLTKSIVKTDIEKTDDRGVEEKIVQVVNEVGLASNLDQNLLKPAESETCLAAHGMPHLKDLDRGCESETDTEEFEKVGQSPMELHFDKDISTRPRTHDVSTLTEDNLQTSQTERDRLKFLIVKMATIARQAIELLRVELGQFKTSVLTMKNDMELQYESLTSSWENLTVEMDNKEKEIVHRITVDHELEINDFKKSNEAKDQQMNMLRTELMHFQKSFRNSEEEATNLKMSLDKFREEYAKEKCRYEKEYNELKLENEQKLKQLGDVLMHEHKAEIENIRARFRLMAFGKSERGPSDPCPDGADVRELNNQEAIILQVKENCEAEKEKAVNAAVLRESRKWESMLNEKLNDTKAKHELDKEIALDELARKISEEKDKQIDLMRDREAFLNLECIKYKNTIQQLAESDAPSQNAELLEKVEHLEKERNVLEFQLWLEKSRQIGESSQDMGSSVAVCEGKINVATSPIKDIEKITRRQTTTSKTGKLSIDTCHYGDLVLILWDGTYKNYRIIQGSSHLYFLHSDCLETLGLSVKPKEDRKLYYTGEVIEKDYCHAKKVGNRYNVPVGTKFFRVKVRPLSTNKDVEEDLKEVKEKPSMSQSEIAGPSILENAPVDTAVSCSLPVTPLKQSPVETVDVQNSEKENLGEGSR